MELFRIYQYCVEPWLGLMYLYLLGRISFTRSDTLKTPFFRIVTWMGTSDMSRVRENYREGCFGVVSVLNQTVMFILVDLRLDWGEIADEF